MSAPEVAQLEEENARLGVALGDAYAVLAKTKTALEQLQGQYDALKYELDWFKRQLFGQKSEKRLDLDDEVQLNLLAGLGVDKPPSRDEVPSETVSYERRAKVRDAAVTHSGLRFGPEVPVKTIEVRDPAIEAIPQAEREVIGEKVSYRLAQQPGSYVVLKYVRQVVKRRDTETLLTAAAPANVLERSGVDVSFLAAMLVDKFCWHLPVYRQHQRLLDAGITLSRSTLIHWASRAIDLLAPVTEAQSAQVLASDVLAMDETSLKAGREAKGKMRTGWLWPVYGDAHEVVFHYARSRAHRHVHAFLGNFRGTLLSDGYDGYSAYAAQRPGEVTHALFRVGGVVAEPLPSQTRTSRFPASGSSHASFAYGGVQLMNEPGRRQRVPGEDCLHLVPGEPPFLAAARQPPLPGQDDALSEPPNAFAVACQTVVGVVPTEHAREASVLVREPPVAVSLAPLPDRSHRTGIAVLCRDLANDVLASSRLPPHVGKAEEVERRSHGRRMPPARTFEPEVDKARLGLVEREPESTEALRQHGKHAPAALKVFERQHWSSSGGEFHPSALTEPDMKLSPHPAPTLQPPAECRAATGRTDCGPVARHVQANAWTRAPGV